MHVITKVGDQINVTTYEHFCDTAADVKKIDPKKITLGSVLVVLQGESGGIEFYIANSNKEWINIADSNEKEAEEINTAEELVELLNDESFSGIMKLAAPMDLTSTFTIKGNQDITIDLNNQTINSTNTLFNITEGGQLTLTGKGNVSTSGNIANVYAGQLIIEDGTYDSNAGNYGAAAISSNAKIIFNGGKLTTQEAGLMAFDGGEIVMNDGEIAPRDNFAIGTNGSAGRGGNTITINGGKLVGNIQSAGYEAIGVYLPNDDIFIMNDGEIIANGGAGIVQRGGSCTIKGGTITATGTPGATGWVGDNKTKMSQSAVIYHETANYPAKDSMYLKITGGTFTGEAHSIEILSDKQNPNVHIFGGTFNPAYPE